MLILSGLLGPSSGNPVRYLISKYGTGSGGLADVFLMWCSLSVLLITICGAFWIIWGIVCISFSPRLYKTTLILAWITIAASLGVSFFEAQNMFRSNGNYYADYGSSFLYFTLCRCIIPFMLLVLLTRKSVAGLFTRGSEAGEG